MQPQKVSPWYRFYHRTQDTRLISFQVFLRHKKDIQYDYHCLFQKYLVFVGGNSKGSGCILSFDIDFVYEDYKDCELSLMIINGDGKNINPIVKHNLYSVK